MMLVLMFVACATITAQSCLPIFSIASLLCSFWLLRLLRYFLSASLVLAIMQVEPNANHSSCRFAFLLLCILRSVIV